jgi:TctA family transporter
MAVMMGAMTIHAIQPGPLVMTSNPELFWGLIVSMWIGNLLLLVLNLPMIGVWVRLLRVPYRLLFPAIMVFCAVGVYSVNSSSFDILLVAAFALVGVILYQLDCEPAPLILGFVLGPMFEENLRRTLLIARGDWSVFVTRPISVGLLAVACVLLVVSVLPAIKRGRETLKEE